MRIVVSQESSERWHAWVPELPGCTVRGRSQQEISRKINQAIRGYLASWDAPVPDGLDEEISIQAAPKGAELAAAFE